METVFDNNALILFFYLFLFYITAFSCTVIFMVLSIKNKWDSKQIAFVNMLIKTIQIPAYIFIFIAGILCFITIFTMGLSVIFFFLACLAILLTGLIGLASIARCYFEGKISKTDGIKNAVFQFIFCIDIVSAVSVYKKSKIIDALPINKS